MQASRVSELTSTKGKKGRMKGREEEEEERDARQRSSQI